MISIKLPYVNTVHTFKYAVNIKSYRKVVIEPYQKLEFKECKRDMQRGEFQATLYRFLFVYQNIWIAWIKTTKTLKTRKYNYTVILLWSLERLGIRRHCWLTLWKWRCLNHTTILIGWSRQFCKEKINCTRGVQEIKS